MAALQSFGEPPKEDTYAVGACMLAFMDVPAQAMYSILTFHMLIYSRGLTCARSALCVKEKGPLAKRCV